MNTFVPAQPCRRKRLAEKCLQQSDYPPLRKLSCTCDKGVITIYGSVPSFFLKQMAQASVSQAVNAMRIDNRVEVA